VDARVQSGDQVHEWGEHAGRPGEPDVGYMPVAFDLRTYLSHLPLIALPAMLSDIVRRIGVAGRPST
jgi:hypothetical protein